MRKNNKIKTYKHYDKSKNKRKISNFIYLCHSYYMPDSSIKAKELTSIDQLPQT